jgi:peptide/nickel transport system permease protein
MATDRAVGVLDTQIEESLRPKRPLYSTLWNLARQNPLGLFGLIIVVVLGVAAVFAPLIAPYDVGQLETTSQVKADPSWAHPFGSDFLGRDMFSRVVFGARISLLVGVLAVGGGTSIALVLGIVSGYSGGMIDNVIQRAVDTAIAFPALLLLLILASVLGPSMQTVILAVGIFIAILAEASLSFLGLGIPVPNPSWGTDVSEARNHLPLHIWWAFFPGLAITMTVLAFNLLGDSLRDMFDPRLRGRL